MNRENSNIINKFLSIGDKFMPEMDIYGQFMDPKVKKYSACGPFTKHQQRIDQFMKDGKIKNIAKNKLDTACFQQGSAFAKYKDSLNRKKSDIVLKNKAFKIAVDPKVDGHQRSLAAIVYKLFNASGIENKQLADELLPIAKRFKKNKSLF